MASLSNASDAKRRWRATPLVTARLNLRPLDARDASPVYLAWLRDPEINHFLESRHFPPADLSALADVVAAFDADPASLLFGAFLREGGTHIGNVKLGPIDPRNGRADLGFLIGDRARWGQGYASEAIAAVRDAGIRDLGLRKVTAGCYAANGASARALEKAGFAREAVLRAHWLLDGKPQDGWIFASFAVGSAV